jgi:hypothetical protein
VTTAITVSRMLIESMGFATVLPFFGDIAKIRNDFLRSKIAKRARSRARTSGHGSTTTHTVLNPR